MRRTLWGVPSWILGIAVVVVAAGLLWLAASVLGVVGTPDTAGVPMPERLEDMTGTEFRDHVGQLQFDVQHGQTRDRECVRGTNCPTAQSTTRVRILAAKGSEQVGPGSIHLNGQIVAMLSNLGKATEARYQLPPNADSIYWLVERGASSTTGVSRIVLLLPNGGWRVVKDSLSFEKCYHPGTGPIGRTAAFAQCQARSTSGSAFRAVFRQQIETSWVSCLAGCCTAR